MEKAKAGAGLRRRGPGPVDEKDQIHPCRGWAVPGAQEEVKDEGQVRGRRCNLRSPPVTTGPAVSRKH